MADVAFWSVVLIGGYLTGAVLAVNLQFPAQIVDLFLVHSAELLATAIGLSVMGEAEEHAGAWIITLGLIGGALLVYLVGGEDVEHEPVGSGAAPTLPRLASREIALNGPAFVALGAGLASFEYVAVPLVAAVFISNYLRAIRKTSELREGGASVRQIFTYWLLIGACLCALAMASFQVLRDSGDVGQAAALAAAAGAMLAALPALEPRQRMSSGTLGFIAALRFGLAFLIASAWNGW